MIMPGNCSLKDIFHDFAADRRGSFIILFGLMAAIIAFAVGTGIDYTRAKNEEARLQAAVDAAVLAGSAHGLTSSDIQSIEDAAMASFNLNYKPAQGATFPNPIATFNFNQATKQLVGSSTGNVPTTLANIFGFETLPIRANATATTGIQQLEYVLAIDQSGSMLAQGRQVALEAALQEFRTALENNLSFGNSAYVGIVPWQTTVNVGPERNDWVFGLDRSARQDGLNQSPLLNRSLGTNGDPNNLVFKRDTHRDVIIHALSTFNFTAQGYPRGDTTMTKTNLEPFFSGQTPQIQQDEYESLSWRGCVMERDGNNTIPVSSDVTAVTIDDFAHSVTDRTGLAADPDVLNPPLGNDRFQIYYTPLQWGQGVAINDWNPYRDASEEDDSNSGITERVRISSGNIRIGSSRSANIGCIRQPMTYFFDLGDSTQTNKLRQAIIDLHPADDTWADTDASLGILWALRMLDPRWRVPWGSQTPSTVPSAFLNNPDGTPNLAQRGLPTRKIIILLTDGQNGLGGAERTDILPETWTAYGDTRNANSLGISSTNLSRSDTTRYLNIRELRVCELAKNLGVEVYTIGFTLSAISSVTVRNEVQTTLNNCASKPNANVPDYSFEAETGNLSEVFREITRQSNQINLTN